MTDDIDMLKAELDVAKEESYNDLKRRYELLEKLYDNAMKNWAKCMFGEKNK